MIYSVSQLGWLKSKDFPKVTKFSDAPAPVETPHPPPLVIQLAPLRSHKHHTGEAEDRILAPFPQPYLFQRALLLNTYRRLHESTFWPKRPSRQWNNFPQRYDGSFITQIMQNWVWQSMGEHASVNRVTLAEGAKGEDLTCNVLSCTITHPVVCKPLVVHEASEHGPREDTNFFIVFFFNRKAHSERKISERGENVSPKHLKLSLIFIWLQRKALTAAPYKMVLGFYALQKWGCPWIEARWKALGQQMKMKVGMREAFCFRSALGYW